MNPGSDMKYVSNEIVSFLLQVRIRRSGYFPPYAIVDKLM